MLSFLELISDINGFFELEGLLEGGNGLTKSEDLLASESFSPESFSEVGFDCDWGLAIRDAL